MPFEVVPVVGNRLRLCDALTKEDSGGLSAVCSKENSCGLVSKAAPRRLSISPPSLAGPWKQVPFKVVPVAGNRLGVCDVPNEEDSGGLSLVFSKENFCCQVKSQAAPRWLSLCRLPDVSKSPKALFL